VADETARLMGEAKAEATVIPVSGLTQSRHNSAPCRDDANRFTSAMRHQWALMRGRAAGAGVKPGHTVEPLDGVFLAFAGSLDIVGGLF
jgi:hypothetical protein